MSGGPPTSQPVPATSSETAWIIHTRPCDWAALARLVIN